MPLAAILTLAPQFIEAGKSIVELFHHVRQVSKQKGEWTEAEEAAFEQCLQASVTQAHWQARKSD